MNVLLLHSLTSDSRVLFSGYVIVAIVVPATIVFHDCKNYSCSRVRCCLRILLEARNERAQIKRSEFAMATFLPLAACQLSHLHIIQLTTQHMRMALGLYISIRFSQSRQG